VLIVDDDDIVGHSLAEALAPQGYHTEVAGDLASALAALDAARAAGTPIGIVLSDVALPAESGLDLLKAIQTRHPTAAVVMITGYGSVESAVAALRLGAVDYLTKPVVEGELAAALERARRYCVLAAERQPRSEPTETGLASIVGSDARMLRVYELVNAVAPSRTTVLMTGESGTGKSLTAHAIHALSPRRDKPFVEISCGSIPETLLESELFGHVKGAFTGAHADKIGRFLAAHTGTIFLDEINSAPPAMQLKLLRVLQERKFEPVGSAQTIEVDVRVVLATNQPLERLVEAGQFRQDLFYRINVVQIELPPLRERPADVPALAQHFLRLHAAELGKQIVGFAPDASAALTAYSFPGNVRELQNIVERAAVLSSKPTIEFGDLPDHVRSPRRSPIEIAATSQPGRERPVVHLGEALREPERDIILNALTATGWNRQRAADQLGINRTTLYKRMKALGIDPDRDGRSKAA
jgi:DNA-binding NtrC family response regulator